MKKKKLFKILKICLIILGATGLIWLILYAISVFFLGTPQEDVSSDISFYEADYNENIFEDVVYQAKVKDLYYFDGGDGEVITDENIDEFSSSAKFMVSYFDTVINGDYGAYKNLFTESFFENYTIPEMFTMQKLYDISVELYDKQLITEDNTEIIVETFIVRYKIMENNGTFRSDVGSNTIKPLVFELYIVGDSVLINKIYFKKTLVE